MTRKYGLHKCLQFGLAGLLGCLIVSILTAKTQAQQSNIVPDNTLASESSQVIGNFQGHSNLGQGNAGNIIIDARENVLFDGANAYSGIGNEAVGNAGNISIKAGLVSLSNNTYMSASTSGRGNAGIININARDSVSFDQKSYAYSLTTTEGIGKSGNVNINASDTVHFDGANSAAFSISGAGTVAKAGGINITTGLLSVTNGAFLTTSILGQGDAGNVSIDARDTVVFDGIGSNGLNSAAPTPFKGAVEMSKLTRKVSSVSKRVQSQLKKAILLPVPN